MDSFKKHTKRLVLVSVVIFLVVAVFSSSFFYLNSQNSYPNKLDNMSFGDIGSDPLAALVHVAQDQNLFAKNGINLTITNYVTGPNNINATLNYKDDVGTSLEYAFVANSVLKEGNLSIVATIDKSEMVFLIARKDRGIQSITDLKAKKIGLTLQTSSLFYFGRFLQLNSINNEEVTLVDLPSSEYVDAFINGTIDAFVAGKSYIQQANDRLPNDTVAWPVQSDQLAYSLVFCRNNWITQHPELVERFLKSLAQAEEYVVNHPVEAKSIIQKNYNGTDAYIAQIWSDHHFSLSLDQSLVSAMEAEARWMINNNLTNQTVVPDFLNYVYLEGLTLVKPESVNVFR
jgi:NitT/TauT family transport system substrate-binding protein